MSSTRSYRHKVTGLIGEFAESVAAIFADVLEPVTDETPLPDPVPTPEGEQAPAAPSTDEEGQEK